MSKNNIYYIRESAIQSIISDVFTFTCLFAFFLGNKFFLGGRWYIDFFMFIMLHIVLLRRANNRLKTFSTNKELLDFLEEETRHE